MERIALAGLVPVGFQVMNLANSTAVAVNSTCQVANVLVVSVETVDARFRSDSTAPTNNTGVLLTKALSPFVFEGYNGSPNMKFNRAGGSSASRVSIMAYKRGH
jgi:hypothetical protein